MRNCPSSPAVTASAASPGEASSASSADQIVELPIGALAPDPVQPRSTFDSKRIQELAQSIRQHGLLQPLIVRPALSLGQEGRYWIVAGERRFRAAQLLGWASLPCRVRAYVNAAAAVVALAENVHREDLSEIEKAEALLRIRTLTERTWDEVAELVRLSRDYVKRLAGLLKLQEPVKDMVHAGRISARTAIALKPLPPRRQLELARRVIEEGLTAEQVRAIAKSMVPIRARPRPSGLGELATGDLATEPEREGNVVRDLRRSAEAAARIEAWMDGRSWSPSRVTEKQRKGLDDLYTAVANLQQQLLGLRRALREADEQEHEKLLRSDPLPF